MGIVYSDSDMTSELRDFSDRLMQSLTEGEKFEPGQSQLEVLSRNNALGILTLENMIEMVL